jgi:hypothetical protein
MNERALAELVEREGTGGAARARRWHTEIASRATAMST